MEKITGAEEGELKLRPIRKKEQAFLTRELEHWRWLNLLDDRQASAISALYEPAGARFLQIFTALGAMLVGLGLLSYVAANWVIFGRSLKVALIVGGYILSVLAAYGLEPHYPHTARAFLLVGSFTYGGGIFLISQIFHEGGEIADALFWWMAGLVPACLLFKDRIQLLLIQAVSLIYFHSLYGVLLWMFGFYRSPVSPWSLWSFWMFLRSLPAFLCPLGVLAALWLLWRHVGRWRFGLHMNIFITLNFIGLHISNYFGDAVMVWLLFFAIGLFLCAAPLGRLKNTLDGWGVALTGVFGFGLSFPDVWRSWLMARPEAVSAAAVVTAIAACAALLWRINKGSLLAAAFFCLMILRYYLDFFYDFMDKALYFTTGGVLLMAMGFYLQRVHKKRRQS